MYRVVIFFLIVFLSIVLLPSYATQSNISDPNLQMSINYPDIVEPGKNFVLSTVVKATADQISNITVTISSPELHIDNNTFHLGKLAKDSAFGNDFNASVKQGVPQGNFVANVDMEYFIKGLFDAQPVSHIVNQTVQFYSTSKPFLSLDFQVPSEVFAGESFSVKGTLKNQGADAHNIKLSVSSSQLDLLGKNSLAISSLDAGKSTDFEFVVHTIKNLGAPVQAVVHLNGTYSDDHNRAYSMDNTFNLFARQRGLLEIGGANGIWVGQFFIAPVVGIGTIVSSVIGFMIFVWHYRNKRREKRKRRVPK